MVPSTLPDNMHSLCKQKWVDVLSQSVLSANLLIDGTPGQLDMMVDMTYPGRSGELPFGQRPVIGDDIKEAARRLEEVTERVTEG